MPQKTERFGLIVLGVYIAWALICLAFTLGIAYVILHFISKYW